MDSGCVFDKCAITVTLRPDTDMPTEDVATCHMTVIREDQVSTYTFEDDMDEMSEDAAQLARGLLDRDATYMSTYLVWGRGSGGEGTGVWSSEFGRGVLVHLEELKVHHKFRGIGIGTKLFGRILEWIDEKIQGVWDSEEDSTLYRDGAYIVVTPGSLTEDLRREFPQYQHGGGRRDPRYRAFDAALKQQSVAFWRKQGFRRIGLSKFFGYATDSNHPSRSLTVEDDRERDDQ